MNSKFKGREYLIISHLGESVTGKMKKAVENAKKEKNLPKKDALERMQPNGSGSVFVVRFRAKRKEEFRCG